ncbi:MAG: hypothetical protein KZQ93_00310 [Candidatus Thiodiazotropha sp. (ex Monitilora ramsayi)]|nr:hypothetical protein [Candidatus Thiodiazotropha sp. (ex Monitilora ramsayi)]
MKIQFDHILGCLFGSALLILAGCGGGGGSDAAAVSGGSVAGLEMPAKMNMVSADSVAERNYAGRGYLLDTMALGNDYAARMVDSSVVDTFPVDADYYLDAAEAETWVWDPSMESLSIVNEILCYVQQTAASDLVNNGAYIALVNEDKCEEGENQSGASSGGAQSTASSSQNVDYSKWTVFSTRLNESSPQIVKIWVPGDADTSDPMDAQRILVSTTINEGVGAGKPFGSFVMNFVGEAPVGPGGSYVEVMQGTLKTVDNAQGKPEFTFFNTAGVAGMPFSMIEKSHVVMDDASGTTGQAKTYKYESFDDMGTLREMENGFSVAYDSNYFLRGKDTDGNDTMDSQVCTSRSDFSAQTWRYSLYHTVAGSFNQQIVAPGQRVDLNSGFPFVYEDSNGSHFGHIGYWGIWTEEDLALTDLADQLITQENYGDSNPAQYTVKVSGGKLWRRTKVTSSYAEVVGVDLNWWGDPADPDCTGPCSQSDYRATVVDNGGGSFSLMVTHSLTWGENSGPALTDIVDVEITPVNDWDQRWLWGDSLGGSVVFKPAYAVDPVVMFKEEVVSPDENNLPTQLFCYERCLKGGLTSGAVSQESDLFHIQWNSGSEEHAYTLSVVNGQFAFTDGNSNPVVVDFAIPAGAGDWYQWGINTGDMVSASVTDWWTVYDADVTYRWETGMNSWNRAVAVVNNANSQPEAFDKPMQFKYTYDLGDDPNGDSFAAGTPFMLEYGGPGNLWGFPWAKLDPTCDESSEDCRWVSELTLKAGVELANGSAFILLPMESEQTMNEVALSNCSGAGLDVSGVSLTLPTAVAGSVDFAWVDRPQVTAAPAVIEGVVQGQ